MTLLERHWPQTLDTLVSEATGDDLQTWTFDDRETRQTAETELAARGIQAHCRSAYKPLLCAFREELTLDDVTAVRIVYPRHPAAPAQRFLLESYPLAALYPQIDFHFEAGEESTETPTYAVELVQRDGTHRQARVLAPNRLHTDFADEPALSPCGWRIADGIQSELRTSFEALFSDTVTAIRDADWGEEPYFERLEIDVTLPIADEPLAYADEVLSLREALHEDLYFSLLEVFQRRSGRPRGDRHLQPGQIVPNVRYSPQARVRVSVTAHDSAPVHSGERSLAAPEGPLSTLTIGEALARLPGEAFTATSVAGRVLEGRYVRGSDRAVMISAGQHANETSSPAGTLQAALELATREGAHFSICPLENPDGYALHQRLIADNPRHMHHAARYTALGDDLEYRGEPRFETAIRLEAERLSGAELHLNLHGYPAHEWTRPLSGYIPRGFEMWTIPKGFFLVMRYQAGWAAIARELLDDVTRKLDAVPGLRDFNERQLAAFAAHAGDAGFEMINGVPCLVSEDTRHRVPLTLVTEYPDETVYGDVFRAGVAAQKATVLAAYDAWQRLSVTLTADA